MDHFDVGTRKQKKGTGARDGLLLLSVDGHQVDADAIVPKFELVLNL